MRDGATEGSSDDRERRGASRVSPTDGAPGPSEAPGSSGHLAGNVMHFARLLRATGMPIGPGRVADALRALDAVDVTRRHEFYWALHAVFVHRGRDREIFREAFRWFWREPSTGSRAVDALMATSTVPDADDRPLPRRVAEAVAARSRRRRRPPEVEEEERPAALGFSASEALKRKDFAAMSADELEEAREAVRRLRFLVPDVPTRRHRPSPRGRRVDLRRTLRASLRAGGSHIPLQWRRRTRRPPPLVVLLDISGSMAGYTRMLLRFLHALTHRRPGRDRVHVFLFGTRLTNVTRPLRARDPDEALRRVAAAVEDWEGGTRIGASLARFNRTWARRVLGQGAVVLLMTDGLDREGGEGIEAEAARLRRSARRLVWLNPLLRWEGFEPLAAGTEALAAAVDEVRPVHDLESLEALAGALGPGAEGSG